MRRYLYPTPHAINRAVLALHDYVVPEGDIAMHRYPGRYLLLGLVLLLLTGAMLAQRVSAASAAPRNDPLPMVDDALCGALAHLPQQLTDPIYETWPDLPRPNQPGNPTLGIDPPPGADRTALPAGLEDYVRHPEAPCN